MSQVKFVEDSRFKRDIDLKGYRLLKQVFLVENEILTDSID